MSNNLLTDQDRELIIKVWNEVLDVYRATIERRFPEHKRAGFMVPISEVATLSPLVAAALLRKGFRASCAGAGDVPEAEGR